MSREIKFRAWDNDLKCMFTTLSMPELFVCFNGDVVDAGCPFTSQIKVVNKQQLMQYTGLKDRNGVEIYDGDIVNDGFGVGEVEYIDDCAAYRVNFRNGRAKWFIDYLDAEKPFIKVIGNIHQNPELLES